MYKVCISCNMRKPLGMYYTNPKSADGFAGVCKECHKERMRTRSKRPDVKAYDRERFHNDPKRRAYSYAKTKEHKQIYPEKYAARTVLNNAVRDRRIFKQPCSVCGTTAGIEAHHPDYSKPLEVVWLCKEHHEKIPAILRSNT